MECKGGCVSEYPETRASLIVRLKDRSDRQAWGEFVVIYRPVVYRLARRKGLQHADAEDLAQQVLASVATAVARWRPVPAGGPSAAGSGRFRTWLHRMARNAIINALTRRAPARAGGAGRADELLAGQPAAEGPDSDLLRMEYRREVFAW